MRRRVFRGGCGNTAAGHHATAGDPADRPFETAGGIMKGKDESVSEFEERLAGIIQALKKKYPDAPLELRFQNGFQLLVAAILSAQCTDERVNQVTETLFRKYPTPEHFLEVPVEELERDIRPTGFYRNKAKALRSCCLVLVDRYGGEVPRDIEELVKLPGVGRKTAAVVLGNAFGVQQGIAVDTHVKRVCQRLELSRAQTPEKMERELMAKIPRDEWTWFSNAMILHGRHTCTARKPQCGRCVLEPLCPFPEKSL
jgi:endonuclease-3